jgi:hypothetical protein
VNSDKEHLHQLASSIESAKYRNIALVTENSRTFNRILNRCGELIQKQQLSPKSGLRITFLRTHVPISHKDGTEMCEGTTLLPKQYVLPVLPQEFSETYINNIVLIMHKAPYYNFISSKKIL